MPTRASACCTKPRSKTKPCASCARRAILLRPLRFWTAPSPSPWRSAWRARIFELAEALFQSIGMQLSVPRYKAIAVDRGANLDTLDVPAQQSPVARTPVRRRAHRSGGNRSHPQLDRSRPRRLLRRSGRSRPPAAPGARLHRPGISCALAAAPGGPMPNRCTMSLCRCATPASIRAAQYRIRVVYAGDSPGRKIRLVSRTGLPPASEIEIHPLMLKPQPVRPIEFDIPRAATATGELDLAWYREAGLGGNGRGCQVAEVWLMKMNTTWESPVKKTTARGPAGRGRHHHSRQSGRGRALPPRSASISCGSRWSTRPSRSKPCATWCWRPAACPPCPSRACP